MTYTIEDGNVTSIYKVIYEKEKLEELLNKIVRECSYKVKGKFKYRYGEISYISNPYRITKGPLLPNGEDIYQDIIKIEDDFDGLSIENVTIEGARVIVPKLAMIVASILNGNIKSLNLLQAYVDNDELISIDMKINAKINELREIINATEVEIDKFIEVSTELKELRNNQKENQCFNTVLLNRYYFEVVNLISYELVSKTIKHSGPVRRLSMSEMFGNNSNK